MTQNLTVLLLPALVLMAAASDILTKRIPNWLNAAIAVTALPLAALVGMPLDALLWHLLAGGVMLIAGFGLFAGGFIGGGDAKMLAAVTVWLGWPQLVPFLVVTALAGGALAIAMKVWQAVRIAHEVSDASWLKQVIRTNLDLPYGVAIAVGCVAVYPQTWWMKTLL